MKYIWLIIFLVVSAHAGSSATKEETFTRLILAKLEVAVPSHKFEYAGSLEVRDATSGGSIYLDRIYGYSTANPKLADVAIKNYVSRIAQVTTEAAKPISASAVRLAVRNSASLKRMIDLLGAGTTAAYPQEFVGDLVVVPVVDTPSKVKYVGEKELAALGLSEAEVRKLGGENLRRIQQPIGELLREPAKSGIGVISEEYAASRLIFVFDWTVVEKKVGGNLIVMAPAFDTVLYGDGSSLIAVDALRTLGLQIAKTSQVPLSSNVFRFHGDRWELVK